MLGAGQEEACRQLTAVGADRFANLSWRHNAHGAVYLDAAAWLDYSIDGRVRAGDHDIVVLRVHDLDADHEVWPLIFHASTFRRIRA